MAEVTKIKKERKRKKIEPKPDQIIDPVVELEIKRIEHQKRTSKVPGRKQYGATVYERLMRLPISKDSELTGEIKLEIGRLISEKFFENKDRKTRGFFWKKTVVEPNGEFKVNVYPSRFVPVMDAVIMDFFKEKVL